MNDSPFLEFFYQLRAQGVSATTSNWLAFIDALTKNLHADSLDGLHGVARCILTNDESEWDAFDAAFVACFSGVVARDLERIIEAMSAWVARPEAVAGLDPRLQALWGDADLEELRKTLLKRLEEQKKRHRGGSKWIGTGGSSPFGQGGSNPAGIRIGEGGGRSALAVAQRRQYAELRRDLTLDTRQLMAAMRGLRRLTRNGGEAEFDLEGSVRETARMAGELELVYRPPRNNEIRVLLLMDVGGSMNAHAELSSRLFSAAQRGGGFRQLEQYYFHNCVYGEVYRDASFTQGEGVEDLIRQSDRDWRVIVVGDAWMHPGELSMTSGDFWTSGRGTTGLVRLAQLADHFPNMAWLNPEPEKIWRAPSVATIARIIPMYRLSVDGVVKMASEMGRSPAAERRAAISEALAGGWPS